MAQWSKAWIWATKNGILPLSWVWVLATPLFFLNYQVLICFFNGLAFRKFSEQFAVPKKNFGTLLPPYCLKTYDFSGLVKYSKRSSSCIWKNSTNFEKIFSRIYLCQINSIPKDNILYFFWESYAYYNQWGRNRGWSEDRSSPKFWKNNNNIWKKWVPILP